MQSLLLVNTVESMIAAVKGVRWVSGSKWMGLSQQEFMSDHEQYLGVLSSIEKYSKVLLSSIEKYSEILRSSIERYWGGRVGTITRLLIISRQAKKSHQTPSQVPRPTCVWEWVGATVYTLDISLWGIPAPKFALEPLKKMVYWISLCIRKPQSQFHKISATHVSPSWRPSLLVPQSKWVGEPG